MPPHVGRCRRSPGRMKLQPSCVSNTWWQLLTSKTRVNRSHIMLIHHFIASLYQWNSASTLPYRTPSTFNSKPKPALSTIISSVKSKLSNSTPLVVVNLVNKLLGTAFRSVVRVHTCIRSLVYAAGGSSASQAIRSSVTMRDWPGRKLRV